MLMQASNNFQKPTTRVNQVWETEFAYLRAIGGSWYYPPTILDDHSQFIVAGHLGTTMLARDVSYTLDDVLGFSRIEQVHIKHKSKPFSDSSPSYVAVELKVYLDDQDMTHTGGWPSRPLTAEFIRLSVGKII